MMILGWNLADIAMTGFVATQALYTLSYASDLYLYTLPVNRADQEEEPSHEGGDAPYIVLFMPVLHELEETMRTTLLALSRIDYPAHRYEVVAVPNADDASTIASLHRLKGEFPFLDIIETPDTGDASWGVVWQAWTRNPKAYWWHQGKRAGDRNLPPKKTRQLIYAFYNKAQSIKGDFLVNYIDADSAPPPDHFRRGAAGMRHFDVLQAENIAGNLNDSLAASLHAFDHMAWDGRKYAHMSADGRQPFWVLGKGLFFRASDLITLGGFHPWITIEDPEVGMRFWKNGKRLGILKNPLIEEVPLTFGRGITQRKRWVCGFFQSLTAPLDAMEFTLVEKMKAWMNFVPCLMMWVNALGVPFGAWTLWKVFQGTAEMPTWVAWLAAINLVLFTVSMIGIYVHTWRRTKLVLHKTSDRIAYMLRVNPIFVLVWQLVWLIPLAIGFWMYLRDSGLVWERTEKINANGDLIRAGTQRAWRGS